MKTIRWALVLVLVAANARSDETANMVSSGAPASRAAIGTESGDTWTGNDADNPLYCELTSAPTLDIDTTGLATTAKQDTGNGTLSAISGQLPAALDPSGYLKTHEQGTVSATQSGTWTVQPGNTANTTAWKVDGSAVVQPVTIEYNADATLASFYEAVSTGRGTYRPTLGGSAPYEKCTARNLGLTNPVCIKAKTGLGRGVIVSARAAATSPPDQVSFRNVSTLEIDTATDGCSGGTTVEITCEQ